MIYQQIYVLEFSLSYIIFHYGKDKFKTQILSTIGRETMARQWDEDSNQFGGSGSVWRELWHLLFGTSLFLRLRSSWTLFKWRFFSFNEINFSCHGQWTLFFIRDIVPHHWHKKRLLDFCCWENVKGCLGEGRIWICSCCVLLRQNKNFKTLLKAVVKNGLFTVRLTGIDDKYFHPFP